MAIVFFKILAQKYPNKGFLFFSRNLQLNKFEDADFKYEKIIFKLQFKSTQLQYLWSQILAFLFLSKVLQLDEFEGGGLKHESSFFF